MNKLTILSTGILLLVFPLLVVAAIQIVTPTGAGVPRDQREEREKRFILETATRNFDELMASLTENSDFLIVVYTASNGPADLGPPVVVRSFLRDRRVSKLHALLTGMSKEEAAEKVASAYADEFAAYQATWAVANQTSSSIFTEPKYGLSAKLFLCSEFCDETKTLELIDAWTRWHQDNLGASQEFAQSAGPCPLMIANLYAKQLIHRGVQLEAINQTLTELSMKVTGTKFPALVYRDMILWDDLAVPGESLPSAANKQRVPKPIPVFPSWMPAMEFIATPAVQQLVLATLRDELKTHQENEKPE